MGLMKCDWDGHLRIMTFPFFLIAAYFSHCGKFKAWKKSFSQKKKETNEENACLASWYQVKGKVEKETAKCN